MWRFQNYKNYFKALPVIPWEVRDDEESCGKKLQDLSCVEMTNCKPEKKDAQYFRVFRAFRG